MIRERVALAPLTTFGIGGTAAFFTEVTTDEEVRAAAALLRGRGFFLLGGGSNVLAPDGSLEALVIKMAIPGIIFEKHEDGRVRAIVGAGVSWDEFVQAAAAHGLWGLENLAGIPGTAGGAAVQNIGAYGAELKDVFEYADVIDLEKNESLRITLDTAAFGYRESVFKKSPTLAVTRVAFSLRASGMPNLAYADLVRAKERGEALATPEEIGVVVRRVRSGKFPDLAQEGTAGSFFKNPVISRSQAAQLCTHYPGLPHFPQENGKVKISLAWLLDHALSLKGFSVGNARVFERQPLVIAASRGASASDVEMLAREIEQRVEERIGITIEREVIHMQPYFS